MAYTTGSAVSMAALQTAIFDSCVNDGWSASGDFLTKAGIPVRIQAVGETLQILGGEGFSSGALVNPGPNYSQIAGSGLVFPLTWHVFTFPQEVYVVVEYAAGRFQWMAWGKSTVAGIGGSGVWYCASQGSSVSAGLACHLTSSSTSNASGALFWTSNFSGTATRNNHIHSGMGGASGWEYSGNSVVEGKMYGSQDTMGLLGWLPSAWNSEAVLLPLRCYLWRTEGFVSLAVDLEHARVTRIDNYEPGQILNIGGTRWKVFPWHLKDADNRNGITGSPYHSGTLGWAIRYEGP
ncbi:hypothetical protein ACNQFN_18690 [Thauera butanivorans]|uniref:hypothetical protein n=1 Tax=Thauera butanivorans TaxID=86174 RepID=UPI003AB8E1A3